MKTKRFFSAALSAAMLASGISAGAVEIKSFSDELTVYLNGTNVYAGSENKPFIMNERTLVPLRPIFEAMGISDGNITYTPDPSGARATFSDGRTTCTFVDNSSTVTRSGENGDIRTLELDVPANIYNGNFYIPLRAFCNLWDMGIEWEDASRSVYVTGNITATETAAEPNGFSFANFIGEWGNIDGLFLAQYVDVTAKIIDVNEDDHTVTLSYKYDVGPSGVWAGYSADYCDPITISYHEETVNMQVGKTAAGTLETAEVAALVTDPVRITGRTSSDTTNFKLAVLENGILYYNNAPNGFTYTDSQICKKIN